MYFHKNGGGVSEAPQPWRRGHVASDSLNKSLVVFHHFCRERLARKEYPGSWQHIRKVPYFILGISSYVFSKIKPE